MFGTAGSQIGPTGSRSIRSRCDPLLHPTIIHSYLSSSHPIHLPLVISIRILHVHLVVFTICALHHVVVMHCWQVLHPAAQTFCWEDLLLGTDYVYALLGFVHLAL